MKLFKWGTTNQGNRQCLTEWNIPLQHALWVVFNEGMGNPKTICFGYYLKKEIGLGEGYE